MSVAFAVIFQDMNGLLRGGQYELYAIAKRGPDDELSFMVAEGGADLLQKWNHGDKESNPVPSDMSRFFPSGNLFIVCPFCEKNRGAANCVGWLRGLH